MLDKHSKELIDVCLKKYPKQYKRSAVMEALAIVQKHNSDHLTNELIKEVADYLGLLNISVAEVATFYSLYHHQPVGKNQMYICHNISCLLRGCDDILDYLQQKINIKNNQVTKDGKISLHKVECLGACVEAPVMRLNNKFYGNLTKDSIDLIVDKL